MPDLYIEYIDLDDLVKMERNPKLHSPDIDKSFEKYGYVEPVCIDEGSGKLVAGHGRLEKLVARRDDGGRVPDRIKIENGVWKVPVVRGVEFESEELAEEYNVTANALTIQGGFDEAELEEMIDELGFEPIGLEALAEEISEVIHEGLEDAEVVIGGFEPPEEPDEEDDSSTKSDRPSGDRPKDGAGSAESDEEDDRKLSDEQWYDQLPYELKGVAQLVEEAYFYNEDDDWIEPNQMQIPNLRPDMLVEELPEDLKVWGDRLSTPNDGTGTWFWNYGATPPPMAQDRKRLLPNVMVSFFTSDNHIESWWANPAYRVGQLMRAGIKYAVVPDFSLWDHMPAAAHIWSLYRAAWMGRYFQEAGLRVIPRIEYFQEKSQEWCLDGIPTGAPVVATQFQTEFLDEDIPKLERNLQTALDIVEPGRLLVYAGVRGRAMVEKFTLPCELTVLPTSSELRKKSARFKEEDPHLIELRKRAGRRKEASRATAQEK